MKYREIKIKEKSIEENFKKLNISKRGFASFIGIDNSIFSEAFAGKLIISEKIFNKIEKGIKELKDNPEVCMKIRQVSKRSGYNSSLDRDEMDNRNREIIEERKKGLTLQEIGDKFNLTRERIRQIVLKFLK